MPRLLPQPAVPVAYEVALWFLDRARAADGHLPAQKLQNLLYLASDHYERANAGRPLAPFAFVANEITVVDPNVYRLLEEGRPNLRVDPVSTAIDAFLGEIWTRYGHATVQHLNAIVQRLLDTGTDAKTEAPISGGSRTQVPAGGRPAMPVVESHDVSGPSLRATHRGRQVAVSPWRPPNAPPK